MVIYIEFEPTLYKVSKIYYNINDFKLGLNLNNLNIQYYIVPIIKKNNESLTNEYIINTIQNNIAFQINKNLIYAIKNNIKLKNDIQFI